MNNKELQAIAQAAAKNIKTEGNYSPSISPASAI